MSGTIAQTEEEGNKIWPELETFNSHSIQQWSLAQQSDWQLIPNRWRFFDTSFLRLLVCLLTQAEAWHCDKKLTKNPQGKKKDKNVVRYLDLIFSVRDCKVQEGKGGHWPWRNIWDAEKEGGERVGSIFTVFVRLMVGQRKFGVAHEPLGHGEMAAWHLINPAGSWQC